MRVELPRSDKWIVCRTMKGHGVVSKSGKTMTYGMQGTDPEGKPFKNTELFEKQ